MSIYASCYRIFCQGDSVGWCEMIFNEILDYFVQKVKSVHFYYIHLVYGQTVIVFVQFASKTCNKH